ncbi:MAG: PAS domain S-box protein [Methylococcaceae bacterium]
MTFKLTEPNTFNLRANAERRLSHTLATKQLIFSNEKLVYELQVHQVELEMQNEELRRMQVSLEESRDKYADLYEFAPVGYLTLTHTGLIDKVNLTASKLLGVNKNKLLNRRFATLITPQDGDKWHLCFANIMKHNQQQTIELTLKGCNNPELPVQLDLVWINSELGISLTDLTKVKQAESALLETKTLALINAERQRTAKIQETALNRLEKIARQVPGMVFQFCMHADGSSHFPFASAGINDLFRLSPEQVCKDASKLLSVIHPEDYDAVMAALQKSAQDLSLFSHEHRIKFDDGTERWSFVNAVPERNQDGSTQWYGFVNDITERKLAGQQMRFQASLLDAVGQAVIATDIEGRITYMNRFAENLYGWRSDEAVGLSILEVTQPQMSLALAEEIMTDLAQRGGRTNEFFMKHRDGTLFPVEVNDTLIFDEQGKLHGNIGISSDISKRKSLEQALQYKNADLESARTVAEEANLAKSVFLSRMSHELRTPLNAILGYSQLLETGTPPLTDTQLVRVKPIINAGWYLLELINEILDLDAIQSGNLSLLPESLSLLEVLHECKALVEVQADRQGIQLNFIPCDSSLTIYSDKTRIKQILLNLLSNAIKYNRAHGIVTVKCTQTVEHTYISINDTGEGLSQEQQTQLFKPFNRLGQERGTKQGTGIGLVVTKVLVEQMGGDISLESTVGVGSEFCVKLIRNDRRINPRGETDKSRI